MTSPVGLNTNVGYQADYTNYQAQNSGGVSVPKASTTSAATSTATSRKDSLFDKNNSNNSLMAPIAHSYEDDLMMANLDFSKIGLGEQQVQNPQQAATSTAQSQQQVGQPQQQVAGSPVQPQVQMNGAAQTNLPTFTSNNQQTVQNNNEIKDCLVKREQEHAQLDTNIGKIVGASAGFFAPLAGKVVELCKGGTFKEVFKVKQLAATCPVLAVAGLGIGMLVDSFVDSYKAKSLQEQQAKQTQQVQQQNGLMAVA